MDSSPLQRRLVFGLVVFVLVGLAVYLIGPAARGAGQTRPRPAHIPAASPRAPRPVPSAQPGSSATIPAGSPDIYQWLPFTEVGLTAAASVAQRFCDAYGTFSYTQTAAAYAAPMQRLSSAALVGQIEAAFSLPGVAAARATARQVSTGTAQIQSIRSFGPGSLTFVVQITEQQTATSGRSTTATSYAVTVTGDGSTWQVSDIELAQLGNS